MTNLVIASMPRLLPLSRERRHITPVKYDAVEKVSGVGVGWSESFSLGHLHCLLASLDLRDDLALHCTQMRIGFCFISVQILCISVTKEAFVLSLLRLIVTFSVFIRSACPHDGHLILFKALH